MMVSSFAMGVGVLMPEHRMTVGFFMTQTVMPVSFFMSHHPVNCYTLQNRFLNQCLILVPVDSSSSLAMKSMDTTTANSGKELNGLSK